MGFLDAILGGKKKLKAPPAADRLFAMSTAYVTLSTGHGIDTKGVAAIVFQPLATADFEAIVMIITSRFLTCASSCAMTPSSSAGESSFMIPVVAQTVALFCDLPIAKALGISVWATATFGLGRSAWMQRRSIIACSSGASCGVTSRAPIACSASLSDVKNCRASSPPATMRIVTPPAPAAMSTPTSSA